MRVVGGSLRGRELAAPKSQSIRPTADRLREALFNILIHAYGDPIGGARVLDLFAGTGALGIEALSHGAAFALFVDEGAEARALLRENTATLGLGGPPASSAAMRPSSDRRIRRAVLARLPRSALRKRAGGKSACLGTRGGMVHTRRADRRRGSEQVRVRRAGRFPNLNGGAMTTPSSYSYAS